jgi:hypothetical protein
MIRTSYPDIQATLRYTRVDGTEGLDTSTFSLERSAVRLPNQALLSSAYERESIGPWLIHHPSFADLL